METLADTLFELAIIIVVFLVLTILGSFIRNKLKGKFINVNELLPEDEVHTLRQVFYLILMALCIVNIFYYLTGAERDIIYLVIFDILLSLYFAITLDKSSTMNKIVCFLLIPYQSLHFILFGIDSIGAAYLLIFILNVVHIFVFAYMVKLNFDKFMKYTNSNGLGLTIIILFVIIFSSFFIAQYTENVNALDSLVIVSNEFTGNGYSVFGESVLGKLNSLLLVWGGYVISGAGVATLTAALLIKEFKKRFAELEKLIEGDDE